MKKSELISYTYLNEEDLPFFDRLKLSNLTRKGPDTILLTIFNRQPNFLRDYEKIYFAKYLSKDCSFYEQGDEVYVAPDFGRDELTAEELGDFFVPNNCVKMSVDELFETMQLGYKNLRVYSIFPGIKYKLIRKHKLTGYPSQDKPWELITSKIDLTSHNLLDFYNKSRKFLGPKKCKYAFQCYDQRVTWEEFEEMVSKYIKGLAAAGVKKGDKVPVCISGRVEAVALYFACDTLGVSTFFIDSNETNIETINQYFNRFDCKITFSSCKDLEKIKEATVSTNISKIFVLSPNDSMCLDDSLCDYSKDFIKNNSTFFEENDLVKSMNTFVTKGENYNGKLEYCDDNSHISLITSTSSSTGEPKLIELSRENIMFELETIKKTTFIHLGPNGVNMQTVPFKYPYGFVVSTLISPYVGKTSGLTPDFSLQNYIKFFEMYKPAYIHVVPSLVKNIVNNSKLQDWDWSFLKYIICGGDKYETAGKEYANKWFKNHNSTAEVKDASGMAEVTAGITAATVGKYNVESVGKPMLGTIVKAVDENGNELPYWHVGRLYYTGANVMQRYNNDEEKSKEVMYNDENGKTWIVTDSYGFVDNEGFVYMCGRDRDFFITYPKGRPPFKVYTDFVEKAINECDAVFDSVVVKKPDDMCDYVSKAYIVLKPDVPLYRYNDVIDQIKFNCINKLDDCAIPTDFEIVPSLKLKPSMKTDKQYYVDLARKEYEKAGEKKC